MLPFVIRRSLGSSVLIAVAVLLTACGGKSLQHAPSPAEPSIASGPEQINRVTGTAAWYGRELQGRKTASGELFDMHALSAAHRTLPLGTVIRVTNLENLKSVNLKITDRGPFIKSRVLDVSFGAAKELGFVEQGTARVSIETIQMVRVPSQYMVQAAIFTEEENARLLRERLRKKFDGISIMPLDTNFAVLFRVQVGSYASEAQADQVANKLMLEGLEPVVLRKD